MENSIRVKKVSGIIHWASLVSYLFIIAPSAYAKITQKDFMMNSMESLGFTTTWTLAIGVAEIFGVALVLIGIFKPPLKTLGILYLLPFMIGAFTTHMANQEYEHFYNSLIMCFLSIVLLATDKRFKIII